MACVPCGDPCSSVSKEDLDRWTNGLKYVLANQISLKMFEDYLHTCKLDSVDILELWKMCNSLLRYMHHKKIEKESVKIRKDYDAIVDCATTVEGLTEHQLRRLMETKKSEPKKILSRVEKLRQTICELMQHDYELFRKKLLKDHCKVLKK
ncbi:RGS domain [Cinara cedri]|uniref:RGS domain n=1 Tax=Cinara cedri TaxID=506608 RepID=A0A5E4MP75_9HEMI|nr:RGS domain [Cinara cedri]